MSDEHDRHTTATDLQLHRIWWRAESCDGCRIFEDDRNRGNIGVGDNDQDDKDGGGGKTDRDGWLMSEAAKSRNSRVSYIIGAKGAESKSRLKVSRDGVRPKRRKWKTI